MSELHTTTAVVLAAGRGSRLDRPDSPKPLVRIGHKPLILWTIENLEAAGMKDIYVVVGYKGDLIKKELTGNPELQSKLHFVDTDAEGSKDLLHSILALKDKIEAPFVITVSDIFSEHNPYMLPKTLGMNTLDSDTIATAVSFDRDHFGRSGAHSRVAVVDGLIKNVGRNLEEYNGLELGVYFCGGKFWQELETTQAQSVGIKNFEDILMRFARRGKLHALEMPPGEWYDINTPATAVRAEIFARKKFYARANPAQIPGALTEVPIHATFTRNRIMQSSVAIQRGILNQIHTASIIPPERITSPHFLLTDSVVDPLYGTKVLNGFHEAGFTMHKLVMPAGEAAKSMETYTRLADEIFAHGLDEGSILVNLGGGVVNNMAGFLASTLYRGIGLIHLPTTTMAQLDAALDFKQAVNSKVGKNLTGAYYPASKIVIDPESLLTLPDRHISNGLAESIKHALVQSEPLLKFFLDYRGDVRNLDFLEEVIRRTIKLKVPLLSGDTKDEYNEMVPQYGHGVGHAVEHLSGYTILHGEAVAIGMAVCAEISKLLGITSQETTDMHYAVLKQYQLPTRVPDGIDPEDITNAIRYDKHYLGKLPRIGLVDSIGSMWNDRGTYAIPVDYPILERAIKENKKRVV